MLNQPTVDPTLLRKRIRGMILFFMIALVLSGVTAFPVYTEMTILHQLDLLSYKTALGKWLLKVYYGVRSMQHDYPFLFYGYDWLAFAHLVIAMAFLGPYRDPVRNKWVIEWALLCCMAIIPLALIAGPIRGIPWFHIVIDCLFGILGFIPLWITRKWIDALENMKG